MRCARQDLNDRAVWAIARREDALESLGAHAASRFDTVQSTAAVIPSDAYQVKMAHVLLLVSSSLILRVYSPFVLTAFAWTTPYSSLPSLPSPPKTTLHRVKHGPFSTPFFSRKNSAVPGPVLLCSVPATAPAKVMLLPNVSSLPGLVVAHPPSCRLLQPGLGAKA